MVVPTAAPEVDAADEGDVGGGPVRVPDDDQLLVVAAASAGAGVQHDLPAMVGDVPHELGVGLLALFQEPRLGAPQQPEDEYPAVSRVRQQVAHLGARAVQPLVEVAPEVQEVDLVTLSGLCELVGQPPEVADPVDQGGDQVVAGVQPQPTGGVAALAVCEEPRVQGRVGGHGCLGVLLERLVLGSRGRDHRAASCEPAGSTPSWTTSEAVRGRRPWLRRHDSNTATVTASQPTPTSQPASTSLT